MYSVLNAQPRATQPPLAPGPVQRQTERDANKLDTKTVDNDLFWYFIGYGTAFFGGFLAFLVSGIVRGVHQTIYFHQTESDALVTGVYNFIIIVASLHFSHTAVVSIAWFIMWWYCVFGAWYCWEHWYKPKQGESQIIGRYNLNFFGWGLIPYWQETVGSMRISRMLLNNLHPLRYIFVGAALASLVTAILVELGNSDVDLLSLSAVFTFVGEALLFVPEIIVQNELQNQEVSGWARYRTYSRYGWLAWLWLVLCWTMIIFPFFTVFSVLPGIVSGLNNNPLWWCLFVFAVLFHSFLPADLAGRALWGQKSLGNQTVGIEGNETGFLLVLLIYMAIESGLVYGLQIIYNFSDQESIISEVCIGSIADQG